VIGWFTLAQQETRSLKIARQIRHREPPWIVIVESSGGIESPSRFASRLWRVRTAVTDDLIDSLQKEFIRFNLHVERCRAKRGRVQPCPGLRGADLSCVEVTRRCGPPSVGKCPPVIAFAFRQVHKRTTCQGDRRYSV